MSAEPFAAVEVIAAKRDHQELTDAQIDWFVDAYVRNVIAEEQMSAMAMAILLNGMNRREIVRWTRAYIDSARQQINIPLVASVTKSLCHLRPWLPPAVLVCRNFLGVALVILVAR